MGQTTTPTNGIDRAITAAGGTSALAVTLGVSYQAVDKWRQQGHAPYRRALEIEAQFGIPRIDLLKPQLAQLLTADSTAFSNRNHTSNQD